METAKTAGSGRLGALARVAVSALALAATGCTGNLGNAGEDGGGGPDPEGESKRFSCTDPAARGRGNGPMRRLTRDELLFSLEAIAGREIVASAAVQQAAAAIPRETTGDLVHELQAGHAVEHVGGLFFTALAVADAVAADPDRRADLFGDCAEDADAACAEAFLDDAALRILKRPIDAARRDSLLAGFADEGGGIEGMKELFARLVLAPEAVFHVEPGRDAAAAGRVRVDDFAVASRVSFALTGAPPDRALLEAAARGELTTPEAVRPHAERLLATPEARRQLAIVLDAWLNLNAIPDPNAFIADRAGIARDGLGLEARQELIDFVTYELFDHDADVATLMVDPVGFPRTERVAKLYGTSVMQGDTPVTLTRGHGGLLLRLGPLLSGQRASSPILRGVYVRKRLLCDVLPSPDAKILQESAEILEEADPTKMSTRDRLTELTAPAACAGCHDRINPIGFTLDAFGPLAEPRTEEIVIGPDGAERARHPLVTSSNDLNLEPGGPEAIDGAGALNDALADSAKVKACIAERFYTHARLRAAVPADDCAIGDVEDALRAGGTLKDAWIRAVVNEDVFYRNAEEGL